MASSPPPTSGPSTQQETGPIFVDSTGARLRRSRAFVVSGILLIIAFFTMLLLAFLSGPAVKAPAFGAFQQPATSTPATTVAPSPSQQTAGPAGPGEAAAGPETQQPAAPVAPAAPAAPVDAVGAPAAVAPAGNTVPSSQAQTPGQTQTSSGSALVTPPAPAKGNSADAPGASHRATPPAHP